MQAHPSAGLHQRTQPDLDRGQIQVRLPDQHIPSTGLNDGQQRIQLPPAENEQTGNPAWTAQRINPSSGELAEA